MVSGEDKRPQEPGRHRARATIPPLRRPGARRCRMRYPHQRLRWAYLHTEQATRFPAVLHLCELAGEYL